MLIRSQNKTAVVDISGKIIGVDEGRVRIQDIVRAYSTDSLIIGEYKDERRAIGVLDNICKAYENSCIIEVHIPGDKPYMMVDATVFQMPAE